MFDHLCPTPSLAREKGDSFYFTGKPCIKGHVVPRRTVNASCVECQRLKARERAQLAHVKAMNKANKQKPEYKRKQAECARSRNKTDKRAVPQPFSIPAEVTGDERKRLYAEEYYKANSSFLKAKAKAYCERPDRVVAIREYKRKWQLEKSRTPKGKAASFMRKCLIRCLHNKRDSTEKILGYRKKDLVDWIESQFLPGMTWANHGEWHIDHIVPISAFLDAGRTDVREINALSNLQPLWARDNLSKGCKVI